MPVAEELTTPGPWRWSNEPYPNDPGTSDLDDEQAVTISLGTVRRAWAALAKVDR